MPVASDSEAPRSGGGSPSGLRGLVDRLGKRIAAALDWFETKFENRKVEVGFFLGIFVLLAIFVTWRPMFPNYDTYYALIWGSEIASGQLPDYDVFKTPTPHPIFNIYTALISLTGAAAIKILLYASLAMYVGLLWGIFRLVKLQIGTLVALVTVLVLLTRTDLMAFAFRSMLDIPFLAMIIWAAVLELQRPRRGTAPLVLLALAGLLRPEAWLIAGLYWLWLALGQVKPRLELPGEQPSVSTLFWFAVLVVSAPVIWLGADWIVTGDPLYSVNSTSEVANELNRQKSIFGALWVLPNLVGGSEKIVNGFIGTLGLGLALYAYRARMLMLAALAAVGVLTYLLIAIAGLSVISRYLVIPSIVLCFGVAFALVGWTKLEGMVRRFAVGLAIVAFIVGVVRLPAYFNNFRELNTSTEDVSIRYSRIYDILEKPKVRAAVENCLPITSFTHETVPIIRYMLDQPKEQVPATTELDGPPTKGTQLLQTSSLDPLQMTIVDRVLRKPWTGFHQEGFVFRGENRAWIVYTTCGAGK